MKFFDPMDCKIARDLIAKGQDLEAARLLVESRHREHRTSRKLLSEIQPRLIQQAERAVEASLWDRADELLVTAAACCELPLEAIALRDRVQAVRRREHHRAAWQAQRLQQARDWAQHGRAVSALEIVRPIDDALDEVVQSVRDDLEQRVARGERYLTQAAEFLEKGLLPAARERLNQAAETHAAHPRLVELEELYRIALKERAPASLVQQPSQQHHPTERTTHGHSTLIPPRFLINDNVLVITGSEAVIGNTRGMGVTVPLIANVHSRHAMIVRSRDDFQVVGFPNCITLVNSQPVTGARVLADGDVIQFGPSQCTWFFRRPVVNSSTAVFDSTGSIALTLPDSATAADPTSPAAAKSIRRFIMLADELVLSQGADGHVSIPELPAKRLCLSQSRSGMTVKVHDGIAFEVHPDGARPYTDTLLSWPSELLIRTTLDEGELLRLSLQGQSCPDELTLRLQAVSI